MTNSIPDAIDNLKYAQTQAELQRAVEGLALFGESAMPALMQYVESTPFKAKARARALRVLQKIGYPANSSALNLVFPALLDPNSSGWESAVDILSEVGEPIVPEIQKLFRDGLKEPGDPLGYIGLLAVIQSWKRSHIAPLAHELIHLLKNEDDLDWYVLKPIQTLGSPEADAAVPIIGEKILTDRTETFRLECINSLEGFYPKEVQKIRSALEQCLQDPSERIRTAAQRILAFIDAQTSGQIR